MIKKIIKKITNLNFKYKIKKPLELSYSHLVSEGLCVLTQFDPITIDESAGLILFKNQDLNVFELTDLEGEILVRSEYICIGSDGYNFYFNSFDGIYNFCKYQAKVNCHIISLFEYEDVIAASYSLDPDNLLGFDFLIY